MISGIFLSEGLLEALGSFGRKHSQAWALNLRVVQLPALGTRDIRLGRHPRSVIQGPEIRRELSFV